MSDVESFITAQVAEENVERDGEQLMTKQEIEALGQAMLNEHGLSDWRVRAVSEDGSCDEDDIAGSYGRTYHEERLIWVNLRYATDPTLVREILLHEIAHALLGREGDQHEEEFRVKLREISRENEARDQREESVECDLRS